MTTTAHFFDPSPAQSMTRAGKNPRLSVGQRWLYAHKLLTYLLVIGSVFFFLGAPDFLRGPVIIYSLLTLYLPLSAFWRRFTFPDPLHRVMIMTQLIFELIIEIGIISASGAAFSPFTGLFYLTIISGALTFSLVGALTIATMATFGYLFVSWFTGHLDPTFTGAAAFWEAIKQSPDDVFFSGFLQALSFYLTAFVAGFFSERLQSQGRQLSDTSRALSRARLQTDEIIQRLTTGLLTIDYEGKALLFNESAETILGLDRESVIGRDFREVFCGRVSELGQELRIVFETGAGRPRKEVSITLPDGSVIPLGISTTATSEASAESADQERAGQDFSVRGVIAIFQDITEVKQMQEKARQSDRLMAVAELSAAIAHEIRNPLAAIAGSVQVLGKELNLEGEEAKLFDLILKESSRLNRMLGDFLSYARAERTSFQKVELCDLVAEALEMLRRHPSYDSNITLKFDRDEPVVYVLGDAGPIKQIIYNLLLNAIEALSEINRRDKRVEISITLQPESNSALLSIADNGPGVPSESAMKIFAPFYSTKSSGSGLGLAIVHRLTELMEIGLELDTGSQEGAIFNLSFRLYEESPAPPLASEAERRSVSDHA